MYNENSFNNYIFWIKVKRIFFMLIFSILGAIVGFFISDYIINVLLFDSVFRIIIIAISTLLFFAISLLITANTGKEVQDGYWKIAVLRKLTVISKKLDNLEKLDNLINMEKSDKQEIKEVSENNDNNTLNPENDQKINSETKTPESNLETNEDL